MVLAGLELGPLDREAGVFSTPPLGLMSSDDFLVNITLIQKFLCARELKLERGELMFNCQQASAKMTVLFRRCLDCFLIMHDEL